MDIAAANFEHVAAHDRTDAFGGAGKKGIAVAKRAPANQIGD